MDLENEIIILKESFKNHKETSDKQIAELKYTIQEQDKRIKVIEISKEKTDYQYEQIMETLNKLNNKTIPNLIEQIEELKDKPVKRYDQVISSIISAIIGGIVGFASTKILSK